jgi:hypothetical protein
MKASFSKASLARRLRKLRRSIEAPLGFNDFVDLDDMVDVLCRWAASLPWAQELPAPVSGAVERRFGIDCPPLSCAEAWFSLRVYGQDLGHGPEVLVVLPNHLAHRGVVLGWAADAVDLDHDRSIATVALPTVAPELRALQRLLTVAYTTAFGGTSRRE